MTISLCMIVRDEQELLPRCLAAAADLYDELIVVDTGSTDGTAALAAAHGARVLHHEFVYPGHMGQARNVGLDAAIGDWIVVLDADEVLQDAVGLRALLDGLPADVTGVQVQKQNRDETGRVVLQWLQLCAWRRGLYRYIYRDHELPLPCVAEQGYHEVQTGVVIEHRPPAERKPGKYEAMLDRLKADVAKWPDHAHPAYFLHRQYALMGQWQESLTAGSHYLQIAGQNDDRCECYGNMAIAETQLQHPQGAIFWLHRALATQPERRTWWVRLAQIYVELGQWNVATALLHGALELLPGAYWQTEPVVESDLLFALLQQCQTALAHGLAHAHLHEVEG